MSTNLPLDAFVRALLLAALPAATTWAPIAGEEPSPPEVVLWIRPTETDELRLSPETTPELRSLARRGVSYNQLALHRDELLDAVRRLGGGIGSAYSEIPWKTEIRTDERDGALATLFESLGRPPPVSSEEKAALRRLRAAAKKGEKTATKEPASSSEPATGKGREASRDSASAPSPPVAAEAAPPGDRTPATEDELLQRLRRALAREARLVVLLDDGNVKDTTDAGDITETTPRRELVDETLGVVLSTPLEEGGVRPPDRLLLVVLVPTAGPAVAIAAGPSIRRGRVRRDALRAEDIACGLARFLGLSESGCAGSSAWIDASRIEPGSIGSLDEEKDR